MTPHEQSRSTEHSGGFSVHVKGNVPFCGRSSQQIFRTQICGDTLRRQMLPCKSPEFPVTKLSKVFLLLLLFMKNELAVDFGCLFLLRLLFGLFLLDHLLLLLQHHHDVGHLGRGDVNVLLVNQLHHLQRTARQRDSLKCQNLGFKLKTSSSKSSNLINWTTPKWTQNSSNIAYMWYYSYLLTENTRHIFRNNKTIGMQNRVVCHCARENAMKCWCATPRKNKIKTVIEAPTHPQLNQSTHKTKTGSFVRGFCWVQRQGWVGSANMQKVPKMLMLDVLISALQMI